MIFVTVGTQLPFPRLTDFMEAWSAEQRERVVIQTGSVAGTTGADRYANLSAQQFRGHLSEARIVISHAGIGSILSARDAEKPIILVPRRADLGEHRNDHQAATARSLESRRGVYIAWEVEQLAGLMRQNLEGPVSVAQPQTDQLVDHIRSFVEAG